MFDENNKYYIDFVRSMNICLIIHDYSTLYLNYLCGVCYVTGGVKCTKCNIHKGHIFSIESELNKPTIPLEICDGKFCLGIATLKLLRLSDGTSQRDKNKINLDIYKSRIIKLLKE